MSRSAAWQEPFLEKLQLYGNEREAIDALWEQYSESRVKFRNSVQTSKSRNGGFRARYMAALEGNLQSGKIFAQTLEPFPDDFLRFRELCCAYQRQRDKKFVRATNQWFHVDAYRKFETSNRLANVFPPGHNKTTLYAIELCTWLIMRDRNVRIAVVQKNQGEASKVIQAVQERLNGDDYYAYMAEGLLHQGDTPIVNPLETWFSGEPFKPQERTSGATWGASQFKVAGRKSGEKDYTMHAFGVGGSVQGGRYDYIILDDVQDPLDADSPQAAAKLLDWFQRVILGRVTDSQKIVVNGNFFSPDDFMHRLVSTYPNIFTLVTYPALIPKWRSLGFEGPQGNGDDELVPLWPEYWSVGGQGGSSLAAKRKEVGERVWHYTWMQEEGSFEDSTFRRSAIEECYDHEMRLGQIPQDVTHLYLGVDPAAGEQGYCAMVLWGLAKRGEPPYQRYLIDVFNKKGMRNWNNVTDQIADFCRAFPVRKVIVEGNNTQKAGLTEHPYFRKQITSLGPRWEVYQTVTGSGARAVTSNYDITVIGRYFDEGLITIPYGGDFEEIDRVNKYVDQLCAWRTDENGHSIKHLVRDMVMATLFAESEAFTEANRIRERVEQILTRRPKWVARAWLRNGGREQDSAYVRNQQRLSTAMEAIDEERESALDAR